jgi:hypothetical protein
MYYEYCRPFLRLPRALAHSSSPRTRARPVHARAAGLLDPLMREWLRPLCAVLPPLAAAGGASLDRHKSFVVAYRLGEDEQLSEHYDNSEVTLNANLGRQVRPMHRTQVAGTASAAARRSDTPLWHHLACARRSCLPPRLPCAAPAVRRTCCLRLTRLGAPSRTTRQFDNGELLFFGHKDSAGGNPVAHHDWAEGGGVGHAVLHLGSNVHAALPISSGERYNLVVWMRSSAHRQVAGCPMCGSTSRLVTQQAAL